MFEKVVDILSNFVEVDVNAITDESTLRNDLGLSCKNKLDYERST